MNKLKFKLVFVLIFLHLTTLSSNDFIVASDTIPTVQMEEYIITASRIDSRLFHTGSSASFIDLNDLSTFAVSGVPQAMAYVPGIHLWSADGAGRDIVTGIRGFHGGGETEYIHVLIDGFPVNRIENSLVNWQMIPLNRIAYIEIMRGGASALYGDAAMGGVINLVTQKYSQPETEIALSYGSFDSYQVYLGHSNQMGPSLFDVYFEYEQTDGFRENGERQSIAFGGKWTHSLTNRTDLTLQSINHIASYNDPGPLTPDPDQWDTKTSLPFYNQDDRDQNSFALMGELKSEFRQHTYTRLSVQYEHQNTNANRTYTQPPLIIDPVDMQPISVYDTTLFGNTKQRDMLSSKFRLAGNVFYQHPNNSFSLGGGAETTFGSFESTVYDLFMGFQNDYQFNYQPWQNIDYNGTGYRMNSAIYINGEIRLFPFLRLIPGLRYDLITDNFDEKTGIDVQEADKTYHAFSPKLSITMITGQGDYYNGSIYFNLGRSFKSPTIYQRTDLQRLNYAMFFEAGPSHQMVVHQADPFANPELDAQTSFNLELGAYQSFQVRNNVKLSLALSGYRTTVDNEIDFDLSSFSYRNIQNSLHQGIESSMNVYYGDWLQAFYHLHLTKSTFNSGPLKGNYLKGVPRSIHQTGISLDFNSGLSVGLSLQANGDMYIDDDNIKTIDSHQVVNSRLSYRFQKTTLSVDLFNVFDSTYHTYGYMVYGTEFLYPAAGRYFSLGLSLSI